MRFMCELGLFENANGTITCLKMASRSDEYTMKLMRQNNVVQINSGVSQEKIPPNRIEEKRTDRKTTIPSDFGISDQVRDWASAKMVMAR